MNLKPIIFFPFGILLFFSLIHCDRLFGKRIAQAPPQTTSINANPYGACGLYDIQTFIVNCYEENGFLSQVDSEKKGITAYICMQQAFQTVWGVHIDPSIPTPEHSGNSGFQWWFTWGNIREGNVPFAHPMHPTQQQYRSLLNQFRASIDTQQFRRCLGVRHLFPGPEMIDTSATMVSRGYLEPNTFISCYQQQLALYKAKHNCSATTTYPVTPVNPVTSGNSRF